MTDRIERELVLSADPGQLWEALTDPAWLTLWLADEVRLELVPGGDAWFRSGEVIRTGWVEEISPPGTAVLHAGRLAFWWAQGELPASRVELTLESIDETKTRLRVVESRPLEILDLVGIRLPRIGGDAYGPALVALR